MIQRACQKNKNRLLALLLIAFFAVPLSAENRPALVIIIDDLGYHPRIAEQLLALPEQVTLWMRCCVSAEISSAGTSQISR